MKAIGLAAAAALSVLAVPAFATDVGVSISIGQPGFYGHIDIGGYPPPAVVYAQPVIIERTTVVRPPVYLRVPPGYAKNWGAHCHEYRACGERVYFVKDDWYDREYVPRYKAKHGNPHDGDDQGGGHGHGNGHGHGKGHDD